MDGEHFLAKCQPGSECMRKSVQTLEQGIHLVDCHDLYGDMGIRVHDLCLCPSLSLPSQRTAKPNAYLLREGRGVSEMRLSR